MYNLTVNNINTYIFDRKTLSNLRMYVKRTRYYIETCKYRGVFSVSPVTFLNRLTLLLDINLYPFSICNENHKFTKKNVRNCFTYLL